VLFDKIPRRKGGPEGGCDAPQESEEPEDKTEMLRQAKGDATDRVCLKNEDRRMKDFQLPNAVIARTGS
jgi:hypothetical protein